ncbi:tripartite tricarboxylate transporter permease [Haloarculaceae archaeon H-GB2-1]|nr:tripartite tricarboxylate transporter permease [Haloarculaceae archaeon H-GB1-1]MEA5407590.1 tripartite tricarboxylate transporter permease [Haloarculaceae archaeon H-GB2-1]
MEFGLRPVVRPQLSLTLAGFVLGGVLLGTCSGLCPGLHANTFALLLAGLASSLPGPPAYVGVAILAAGTVHTFLDVVPALALGVPDAAMAPTALPGHRLVLAGRGHEALRLSALGSGAALLAAVPLAVPVTALMRLLVPVVEAHLSVVMAGVVALLVATERDAVAAIGAVLAVAASGLLGVLTLDLPTNGLVAVGGTLTPLFSGLFGAPVLLDALDGSGIPPQDDAVVTTPRRSLLRLALTGTCSGAIVSYVPGISSAIAATAALTVSPSGGPRRFLITTSAVNTATAVFALFSLVSLGAPHTGVTVALDSLSGRPPLAWLLVSVLGAGTVGAVLVPTVGDRYLRVVGRADNDRLSIAVLAGLIALSWVVAGPTGVGIFAAATLVGHVPQRFGARRSSLMGVLLVPLAL